MSKKQNAFLAKASELFSKVKPLADKTLVNLAPTWVGINKNILIGGIIILTTALALCFGSIVFKLLLIAELVGYLIYWLIKTYEDKTCISFDKIGAGVDFIQPTEEGVMPKDLIVKAPLKELQDLMQYVIDPTEFDKQGYIPDSNILFVGDIGSGKSSVIRAFANATKLPIIQVNAIRFLSSENLVDSLFEMAQFVPAYIIEIDSIESFNATISNGEGVLNPQILIDKLLKYHEFYPNVLIFATCEEPEKLADDNMIDKFFRKIIAMEAPNFDERLALIKEFTKNLSLDKNVNFDAIAKRYIGYSIGELKQLVKVAIEIAHKDNRNVLNYDDFFDASDFFDGSTGGQKHSAESQKLVAYHEAGHAIVSYVLNGKDSVIRVISTARGEAGGYTAMSVDEESVVMSEQELLNRICMSYGGRCAEKIVFNHLSTGASSDIQSATSTILQMVQSFGMSEEIGPLNVSPKIAMLSVINEGSDMQNLISHECVRIAKECEKRTMELLQVHRTELDILANYLIEHETITSDEMIKLLEKV